MSKIVEFPQSPQAIKPVSQQVLERPVYSLSDLSEGAFDITKSQRFGATVHGAIETPSIQALWPPLQDWSNQELASLYRAHRLLNLTGISFDVDRGLSDENEPWFVFLDEADKVFAHFCRIDGTYYLDSAAQDGCIVAPSLEALVESFARRNETLKGSASQQSVSSQVIDFKSPVRTKVLMHPGVSLAALIWSVYVLSDGLILPLWTQGADDHKGRIDSSGAHPVDLEQASLLPELSLASHLTEKLQKPADILDTQQNFDGREVHHATHNSVFGPGGIYALNIVGFGLTAVSMSYGIYKLALPTSVMPQVKEMLKTASGAISIDDSDGRGVDLSDFLDAFSGAINMLSSTNVQMQSSDVVSDVTVKAHELLEGVKTVILTPEKTDQVVKLEDMEASPPSDATPEYMLSNNEMEVGDGGKGADSMQYAALSEQDFFQKIFEFDAIELGKLGELVSSFSPEVLPLLEGIYNGAQGDDATSAPAEGFSESMKYTLFDEIAHDFVLHIFLKDQGPQRSTYKEEIVIIDMAAFDGSGGDVYARSWVFEDGSVLSTVGLKSDFEAFGLIV